MNLYLLRHAEAEPGDSDADRRLTRKGEKQTEQLAKFLRKHEVELDIREIWHSPLVRAVQTAEIFKNEVGLEAPLLEAPGLRPADDPRPMGLRLACSRKSVLVVGHNPHFELLASCLLSGATSPVLIDFKKSGLLHLERAEEPGKARPLGHWILSWYIIPRLL
ncbi:MAG TPA: phosphohistidine phosphatase SixA [Opitutales bacterium]|nr:phosphohistidine phosphatase SixA [Opitutales bacterium]